MSTSQVSKLVLLQAFKCEYVKSLWFGPPQVLMFQKIFVFNNNVAQINEFEEKFGIYIIDNYFCYFIQPVV